MKTENLNLVKPDLEDHIHQTILDLASNFQKIDDVAEIYIDELPTSGFYNKNKRLWFKDVDVGEYIGAVCIRSGEAAPKWGSLKSYSIGDTIIPTVDNGHYYMCVQSGYSGPNEPTWNVDLGSETEDTKGKEIWEPSKYYNLYDVVVPTADNGRFYVCTVEGLSGASEPGWSTTDGVTTSDNEVVWTTYRIIKWKESGVSALFSPFGKIEVW